MDDRDARHAGLAVDADTGFRRRLRLLLMPGVL